MEKDPEDIILEWCALEDFHSGGMVYEQDRPEDQPQDQSEEEIPLEIIKDGAVAGYIWIVIDNILVATSIPELTDLWRQRIERNGRKLGVYPWKENYQWDQDHLEFTGILFEKGEWRHGADRIERWTLRHGAEGVIPPIEPSLKPHSTTNVVSQATKILQKMVGVLVWNCRLRGLHMRNLRHCFGIQTRSIAGQKTTPEEWGTVNEHWAAHIKNPASSWDDVNQWPPTHAGRPQRVLVTDASDDKWSWLELVAGRVKQKVSGEDENPSGYFDDTVRQWKIYYKELITIVFMMQTLDAEGVTDIDIVLVGDSKAVIGSLKESLCFVFSSVQTRLSDVRKRTTLKARCLTWCVGWKKGDQKKKFTCFFVV